jgi:hypothetical protein
LRTFPSIRHILIILTLHPLYIDWLISKQLLLYVIYVRSRVVPAASALALALALARSSCAGGAAAWEGGR